MTRSVTDTKNHAPQPNVGWEQARSHRERAQYPRGIRNASSAGTATKAQSAWVEPASPCGEPEPSHPTRSGFTLVELMVSVAVLVIMILGFNIVLTQSQKVVTSATDEVDGDSIAGTIDQILRRDLAAFDPTDGGFIAVVAPDGNNTGGLVFTARGDFQSSTYPFVSVTPTNGRAIVCYSFRANASSSATTPPAEVLTREAILVADNVEDFFTGNWDSWDEFNGDPDDVQYDVYKSENLPKTRAALESDILDRFFRFSDVEPGADGYRPVPTMATTINDVRNMYPVLASPVTTFEVHWMDSGWSSVQRDASGGSTTLTPVNAAKSPWSENQWNGRTIRVNPGTSSEHWTTVSTTDTGSLDIASSYSSPYRGLPFEILGGEYHGFSIETDSETGNLDFDNHEPLTEWDTGTPGIEFEYDGRYAMLWRDGDDPQYCPEAIKIRFTILNKEYEIVCPVGAGQ